MQISEAGTNKRNQTTLQGIWGDTCVCLPLPVQTGFAPSYTGRSCFRGFTPLFAPVLMNIMNLRINSFERHIDARLFFRILIIGSQRLDIHTGNGTFVRTYKGFAFHPFARVFTVIKREFEFYGFFFSSRIGHTSFTIRVHDGYNTRLQSYAQKNSGYFCV